MRSQLRLVARSVALWTPLSVLSTLLFFRHQLQGGGTHSSSFQLGDTEGITPVLGILAAALGARLFSGELGTPEGIYWRSLPLAPRRLFWTKYGFGLGVLAAVLALHALWLCTGLEGAVQGILIKRVINTPADGQVWLVVGAWMTAVFSVSAYFACAFDRPAQSWQAGLPGFFAATIVMSWRPEEGSVAAALAWLAPVGSILLATTAAAALWPERAVASNKAHELVRPTPRLLQWPVLLAAQLTLVVVPWLWLLDFGDAWPYFGLSALAGNALLWLGIGAVLLPWSISEVRAARLRGVRALGVLALCTTGVGALLWRAVRPRDARRPAPVWFATPAQIGGTLIVGSILGMVLLGGQRYARAWHLTASDPSLEIVLDGEVAGRGDVLGVSWGRPLGSWLGAGRSYSGTTLLGDDLGDELGEGVVRLGTLAARATAGDDNEERGGPDLGRYLLESLGGKRTLELHRNGQRVIPRRVRIEVAELPFRTRLHLRFEVDGA